MSQEQYDEVTKPEAEVIETFHAAFQTGDPSGELAQKASRKTTWVC